MTLTSVSRTLARRAKHGLFRMVEGVITALLRVFRGSEPRVTEDQLLETFGLSAGDVALVLAPHPDDETLGMGATIRRLVGAGVTVHVVLLTDGRLSQGGILGTMPPEDRGEVRKAEFHAALGRLSERISSEGPLRAENLDRSLHDDAELWREIEATLRELAPVVIFAPPPFDYHPDHRSAAALALKAASHIDRNGAAARCFFYEIQAPFSRHAPTVSIAASPEDWACKHRAVGAYATQAGTTALNLRLARYRRAMCGDGTRDVELFLEAGLCKAERPLARGLSPNPFHDLRLMLR